MRVSEAQSSGPSAPWPPPRPTARRVSAEPAQAPMGLAVRRLGHILGDAVVSARESFGHESVSDPFNGLYITPVDAERALEIAAIDPVAGVDSADIRPDWTEICRHDPHWHWLRTTYGLSEFELDVVLSRWLPRSTCATRRCSAISRTTSDSDCRPSHWRSSF